MKKTIIIKSLSTIAFAFMLIACNKAPEIVSLTGKTMGTTYHIKYIEQGDLNKKPDEVNAEINQILIDVNNKMSTYQADSELSRFNQNTTIDTPIEVSPELALVVKEAIRLNKVTEGALDITVGPVVNLWGFGPEKRPDHQPTAEQLAERQSWVGIDKLTITEKEGKSYLNKSIPQLYLDLSSIAKGYGVDVVAEHLEKLGIKNYLVEIGGEVRAKGKNIEGQYWQIAIEKPTNDGSRQIEHVIGLKDMAMATSGDYRIYFEENGKRFAHEINPKTGYPIQHHLASITVLRPTSMTADGLSTGLFVLGEEKALQIADQYNIPVYLIIKSDKGFEVKMSSAFKSLMEQK